MFAPIVQILRNDPAVTSILGDPPRAFDFGEVTGQDVPRPYLVFQNIAGSPYNTLDCPPDTDAAGIQIDIYAEQKATAKALATTVRIALEKHSYMVSGPRVQHEEDTRLYRVSMDFDFHLTR